MNLERFENLFEQKIRAVTLDEDPAHDLLHFKRVARTAKNICLEEKGQLEIVVPAAWLHDLVWVSKSDPRRPLASKLSAEAACDFLKRIDYPSDYSAEIAHAIEAHSFSAQIEPKTLEAKIVQDADRLDGLGAIGVARCFAVAGLLKRPLYSEEDPFCKERLVNDREFTIDHFYAKLFKVAESLQTRAGQEEGRRRVDIMKKFLFDLQSEIL